MKKPLISIITASYNSSASLEKTIQSVLSQSYANVEHVIVDGGSTDETLEILKKYQNNPKIRWISEPDKGIADAFNKGLLMAQGEFINFQGAGDIFADDDAIEEIMQGVDPETDWLVCGRIKRVSQSGQIKYISSLDFKRWKLIYKMGLPHQALFTNRKFFEKFGKFDINCKYAMDYELLLRAFSKFPKVILKDVVVSEWEDGGIGAGNTKAVLDEYHKIRLKNKIAPVWLLALVNNLVRLRYIIRKEEKLFQSNIETAFNILKFIFENNPWWRVPLVIVNSFFFHLIVNLLGHPIRKTLFNGKRVILFPGCNISSLLVYSRFPEQEEISFLRNLADKETVFMDIGANVGYYSIALADKAGQVIAFEPHPFTASRCRENFILNNLKKNDVKEIALSAGTGKIFFSDFGGSSPVNKIVTQAEKAIEVQTMTLDDFITSNNYSKEHKYLLKVDVEGFEANVFTGAKNFFQDYNIEGIIFECFGSQRKIVASILEKYGFAIHKISTNNFYATRKA